MIKIYFFCFLLSLTLTAQTDWVRWEEADISYEINSEGSDEITAPGKSGVPGKMLRGLKKGYKILISDVDGDNCPFYPTCSAFLVDAVEKENFFIGSLIFADRFTRDFNITKRRGAYPLHSNGRLFDPVKNYSLRRIYFNLHRENK